MIELIKVTLLNGMIGSAGACTFLFVFYLAKYRGWF